MLVVQQQPDSLCPPKCLQFQEAAPAGLQSSIVKRFPALQHSFPNTGWFSGPTSFWELPLTAPFLLSSLQSDSSYDFLSAEEKECLLFLEETIGSLDTEADSGLSTDESEQATTPQSPRALPITQPAPQGKRDCLG